MAREPTLSLSGRQRFPALKTCFELYEEVEGTLIVKHVRTITTNEVKFFRTIVDPSSHFLGGRGLEIESENIIPKLISFLFPNFRIYYYYLLFFSYFIGTFNRPLY